MRRVMVHRATDVEQAEVIIAQGIPFTWWHNLNEGHSLEDLYETEATELVDLLWDTLPSGTVNRVVQKFNEKVENQRKGWMS